jgi:flagellin
MEKDIRGLGQANRNANDAISAVQIAEGAYGEQLEMLNRMSELTIQSLSGTYTDTDRDKMQVEFAALILEIDRVADNTKFNGTSLLAGVGTATSVTLSIQIGTGSSDALDVVFKDTTSDTTANGGLDITGQTIATSGGATTAQGKIDTAIGLLTTAMADMGSYGSRLDSVISNNTVMKDATALAKGRIMDADFAVESANLAKSNVLLQVSQSMLAQANQQPSLVLGLIK